MNHKFACADFTFPLLAHDKVLDLIALLEFQGVDIGLFENRSHLWPSREFQNLDQSAKTLRQKLTDRGLCAADVFLQLEADFVPYAINHPESARRDKARQAFNSTLDYAQALGCEHVTILPGVAFENESPEDSRNRAVDELAWRVQQAKQRGIVFGVEAHVGSIVSDPVAALALVKSVPGLTLTLDYTHFTRLGMPDAAVEPLLAHASHFHVRGACKGRLQASLEHNTIDYQRVFDVMNKQNYTGWIGIEYVWMDWEHCNEVDNISETIRFRDLFRKMAKAK